jgi:H+/gluconate symporter-like permease
MGACSSALHRTAVFATTTFESMPYCGAAILTMQLSGVSHKEGYMPVFVVTVLIPLIATGVVTSILTIFPGLA